MKNIQLFAMTILYVAYLQAAADFTNIKCNSIDKEFADIDYCLLKSINRTYKYMSLKVKLYKVPITNVTVTWAVMKKANGYKPFLYNFTFDACNYLKSPQKHAVVYFFHQLFMDYTNMNHSCPFDHDLIVEKLPVSHINHMWTNVLPMPNGEYGLFTTWSAYGRPRAYVNVYIKLA